MSLLFSRIIKQHWLDLIACVVFTFTPIALEFATVDSILVLMIAIPVWLIIRLYYHCCRNAEVQVREPVAVTLLPARRYLKDRFRLQVFMLLLVSIPGLIIGFAMQYAAGYMPIEFFEIILTMVIIALLIIPAFAGAFHLLYRQCRNRETIGILLIFLYYAPLFILIYGVIALNFIVPIAEDIVLVIFATPAMMVLMLYAYIYLLIRNWKRACAAYYKFE